MAIPSGEIEQQTEKSDADDTMEDALAGRNAEPMARDTPRDGVRNCGSEAECPRDHTHRIRRIARPEDEPEHSEIRDKDQQDEPVPGALKDAVAICFR
jgi:hypothetical protein